MNEYSLQGLTPLAIYFRPSRAESDLANALFREFLHSKLRTIGNSKRLLLLELIQFLLELIDLRLQFIQA
jgi:hypothetical protein